MGSRREQDRALAVWERSAGALGLSPRGSRLFRTLHVALALSRPAAVRVSLAMTQAEVEQSPVPQPISPSCGKKLTVPHPARPGFPAHCFPAVQSVGCLGSRVCLKEYSRQPFLAWLSDAANIVTVR